MLSDKLFYWLFQSRPDRILNLLDARLADAGGYRFSAPALKEREYRLDGLFLPPPERPELPALILEAQMGPDPGFLRRLYAESARLLQQEPSIHAWQVVVITPSRQLNFGASEPVAEFLACRVQWIELLPELWRAGASKFHRRGCVSWAMTLLEPHQPRPAPKQTTTQQTAPKQAAQNCSR